MKWLKISFISSLIFSVLFSTFSLIFYFGDWSRLIVVAIFGVFIGLLAAPEIDRKAFDNPLLFQVFSAAMAGAIIGYYFSTNIEIIVSSCIIGGFIGWLAPYWLKHVQIP